MLQSIEEKGLVGGNAQHSKGTQPEQVAPIPDPSPTRNCVQGKEHYSSAQHSHGDQGARGKMREHKTARDGQAGKQELDHHQRKVN